MNSSVKTEGVLKSMLEIVILNLRFSFLISHLRSIFRTSFMNFFCLRFNCDTDNWTHFCQSFWAFGPADGFDWNKSSLLTDRNRSQSTMTLVWSAVVLNSSVVEKYIVMNFISHPFTISFHICLKWLYYFILKIHFHCFSNHIWWTNVTPLGIWAQVTFHFFNASKFSNLIKLFIYKPQLTINRHK